MGRKNLWQSDIKYGIHVNGQPAYMLCFLDDCTRNVMHSEFYSTLDQKIVQNCFRKALLKFGAPDSVFFGNGVQFLETVADAFLSCEKRKVDKAGCISFCGQKYEVELGISMIHRDVEAVYAPAGISTITIECDGFPSCHAKPLVITGHAAPEPKLPGHYEKKESQTSRLLDAAAAKNRERQEIRKTAISFTGMEGGVR